MHVLMISLDSSLLGDPRGNTVERHLEYARRIGALTIVAYNPANQPKAPQQLAANLAVYPTNTRPPLFPWVAYRVAARLHRQHPADLVTTQDPFACGLVGLLLKWRFGLPLNVQSHSHFFDNPHWLAERPLRNRALALVARIVVPRADTLRVLSEREKAICVRHGVDPARVFVLTVPTDVSSFAEPVPPERLAALRAALGIAAEAPVLLWVGFPAASKHVELLLAAYGLVQQARPSARLVMAGDFQARPDFVRQAQAAGVIFPGRVDYEDLPAYYQLASIYVHSSRYEGVARVLIEALASGTPVVCTDHLGAAEVVRHGVSGLLTEHTPEALAEAIIALLDDPLRARAMGAAGQRDVLQRFDYERGLEAVAETYRMTLRLAGRA